MQIAKRALYVLLVPLLFLVASWTARRRITTNFIMTMTRLKRRISFGELASLVTNNVSAILGDRARFLAFLLPPWIIRRMIKRHVTPQIITRMSEVMEKNRNAIFFSCHMGSYYTIPAVLAQMGYPVTAVEKFGLFGSPVVEFQARRFNAAMRGDFVQLRTIYDNQLLRKLKRSIDAGRSVFMMGDYRGGYANDTKCVRFFGYDIVPGRGLAWLHWHTGAPLIPVAFSHRSGRPRLRIYDALNIDKNSTIDEITQQVYRTLESIILQQPERWVLWIDYHLMLSEKARREKITIPAPAMGTDMA